MSIAGIRSNRGDGYQTLVALEWTLFILSESEFQWLEIDSAKYLVDDVVVGKTDGTVICCQCKKNQKNFKAWTIADLADELVKAAELLDNNKKAEVRFYSRSPFGAIAKLREHSITQADETSYIASLGNEQQRIDADLAARLATQAPNLSTYHFLRRTIFETSPELERMEELLHDRLRYMATNPKVAYDSLWTRLDQLGARMSGNSKSAFAQNILTKNDLKAVLHQAGAMLAPTMDLSEVRTSFASTSAIGRSWNRDIAGERISSPVLEDLLAAIDAKNRAVLLTGMPGSGKTCVMLTLQERLEQRALNCSDIVSLFIQSREFADLPMERERRAQGLPEQWVEKAARMAEDVHVVIVIDSLDVLSIAREHSVLKYFLAQIDRLLLIPNITVVTACRDFDRHYDRRIAERKWDYEAKCLPLNYASQIEPLLDKLGVDTKAIDTETQKIIRNPRELSLFVELAQRKGSFNIVSSQELAQKYLDTIVRADDALGEVAVEAIEFIATEMLNSRRIAVPHQRFTASQDIKRLLCSLNVLQETQNGELMFGHQTLLDILVISNAIRRGLTLNQFIQNLTPVPFVRPSIRSFIGHLKIGDRGNFRKQLRTVLTGNAAFHIRRLVAESFAEQIPYDEDWPMILELRENHQDIFQIIYTQARRVEWHYFWLNHLLPVLKDIRDAEGLAVHVRRVSQWKNEDAASVLDFWSETLEIDWMDEHQIAFQIGTHLSNFDTADMELVAPLLKLLLSKSIHGSIGHAVSRCVTAGSLEDIWLWRYIAGNPIDEDVTQFPSANNLRCQSHEFGDHNDNFLFERMVQSQILLNLALESVEQWSRSKSSYYGDIKNRHHSHFLHATSYKESHSKNDHRHRDSKNILFDAMETAILKHAKMHSEWWQTNRERLCFNNEGALRYFAILAFTSHPETNIDLIKCLLTDKNMIESNLSFELGTLIGSAFIYLDLFTQDKVMTCILRVWEDKIENEPNQNWILKERANFIATIPRYLRSNKVQKVLNYYEKLNGVLIRTPDIQSCGGIVRSPFSFEVFHKINDILVLRLLLHYSGYERDLDDFLIGGDREVGRQLCEASSRNPTRFLRLLSIYWADIPKVFLDAIIDGVANYLAYRYGNLQPNGKWEPLEEPDASVLAMHILCELERHPTHWYRNRSASRAIRACAHVIKDTQNAARLVFLAIGFANFREENTIKGDSVDLITTGINMMKGHVAEASIMLTNSLQEHSVPFPELLSPTLRRFAMDEHPAIRALIIRHLPYLQSQNYELGWDLFHLAMIDSKTLWQIAEPCLYYAYHRHFDKIAHLLERIPSEGVNKDLETWGRISALATLSEHIDVSDLTQHLKNADSTEAWQGASSVWAHPENYKQQNEKCSIGIKAGLKANAPHAAAVALKMKRLFRESKPTISIPIELITLCFSVFKVNSEEKHDRLFGFDEWLNATSQRDPEYALFIFEIYLNYIGNANLYLFDHKNNLVQLMSRLFAEAEEREESDQGAMLQRVVSLQDKLLSLEVDSVNDWLKAAERP